MSHMVSWGMILTSGEFQCWDQIHMAYLSLFSYFDFHPAPNVPGISEKTHGVIPVWAFGTIVESTLPALRMGERVL